MTGLWRSFVMLAAYHLIVGCVVVSVIQTMRPLSDLERVEWVVGWPVVVGANVYMQDRWVRLMYDVTDALKRCTGDQP